MDSAAMCQLMSWSVGVPLPDLFQNIQRAPGGPLARYMELACHAPLVEFGHSFEQVMPANDHILSLGPAVHVQIALRKFRR